MLYQDDTLSVHLLQSGIAELSFAASGLVNKLDQSTLWSLEQALIALEQAQGIQGLMLTSQKDSFITGADITEFPPLFSKPDAELPDWLTHANSLFNRIEDLPFPTVSVIRGYALGGGCECILSTDYRIGDASARIGLPETRLGIMPGFGGTIRLPRLIGADNAVQWIISGQDHTADTCLALGLLDAVVATEQLRFSAIKLLHDAASGTQDWQAGRTRKCAPLNLNQEASTSFARTRDNLITKSTGHCPSSVTALDTLVAASALGREPAQQIEQNNFVKLTKTPEARALIGNFLNAQFIKGKAKRAARQVPATRRAVVIGAGIMGGGIAYQSAIKGIPVLLKDINQQALELGMNEAEKLLDKQLEQERIDEQQRASVLTDITPILSYDGLAEVDLVVEAVVENPDIKARVLAEVEGRIGNDSVLASNTSTIPISQLANSLQRPDKFCGMHFFNPVHRMPLVEVIRGKQTSDDTINRTVAYAAAMGKTPIVVNDCPGFFINRVLFPYLFGFCRLVADGADFVQIDTAMEQVFGWPMGPAYLLDVIGMDTCHHAAAVLMEGFPERMAETGKNAIDVMYEQQHLGQKNGKGFYAYTGGRLRKEADTTSYQLLKEISSVRTEFEQNDIIARMMIPMINEVMLCLEEGIIGSPAEADTALIHGLGFPAFRGGVCRYLDTMGLDTYVTMADRFAHLGPLYQVSSGLRRRTANNKSFYDQRRAP